MEHVCSALEKRGPLPKQAIFIKTIVTTELLKAIADSYGKPCINVLTGFKYFAEKITEWEQDPNGPRFLFGGEESYGYLFGTHCRDKDAVVSCALISEAALQAKLEGRTLIDKLHELYHKYGIYRERLIAIKFDETKAGREKMQQALVSLRKQPPKRIGGVTVVAVEDYLTSTKQWLATGKTEPITLPQSNVLLYWLEDDSKIVIRPSGTEPKVKLYGGAVVREYSDLQEGIARCDAKVEGYLQTLKEAVIS